MRTTLEIDDDLLAAAKELARVEGVTAGNIVSRLLRRALTGGVEGSGRVSKRGRSVAGFVPFPALKTNIVTNEQINLLRDREGI